jgi:ABC-type branched-subunit amino acid transport system substrate-binding protein
MLSKFGLKTGDRVLTVDSAEAYSVPLVTLVSKGLSAKGVDVDRQSQPAADTDFTALANRAIAERVKAVFWAGQVASSAQLFYKQLKSKGFSGGFMAPDGAFVQPQFNTPGAYISSFSLDIHDVPVAQPFVKSFESKYGKTNSFGAPTFVAMQAIAEGVSMACADGKVSRGEVRVDTGKVKMPTSLIGKPIAFDKFGDVVGGIGFTIFQIADDGSYQVVQKG